MMMMGMNEYVAEEEKLKAICESPGIKGFGGGGGGRDPKGPSGSHPGQQIRVFFLRSVLRSSDQFSFGSLRSLSSADHPILLGAGGGSAGSGGGHCGGANWARVGVPRYRL